MKNYCMELTMLNEINQDVIIRNAEIGKGIEIHIKDGDHRITLYLIPEEVNTLIEMLNLTQHDLKKDARL